MRTQPDQPRTPEVGQNPGGRIAGASRLAAKLVLTTSLLTTPACAPTAQNTPIQNVPTQNTATQHIPIPAKNVELAEPPETTVREEDKPNEPEPKAPALIKDPDEALRAMTESESPYYFNFRRLDPSLSENPDFILSALKMTIRALEFASDSLTEDPDFLLKAIKINNYAIRFGGPLWKDRNFILKAIRVNPSVIACAHESLSHDPFLRRLAGEPVNGSWEYACNDPL